MVIALVLLNNTTNIRKLVLYTTTPETDNVQMRSLVRLGFERTYKSWGKQRGIGRCQIYGGNAADDLKFVGESTHCPHAAATNAAATNDKSEGLLLYCASSAPSR